MLGSLGVPELDLDRERIEIGYWLAPSARGRGIGARAVRLFCSWALEELALARVEALPEADSTASQRLLERVGFKREGVLRSYELAHGTRRDLVMYSLLPGELRPGDPASGGRS